MTAFPRYEIRRELVEITANGWLGGRPDVMRRFVPGPPRYYRNDAEITEAEYNEAVNP